MNSATKAILTEMSNTGSKDGKQWAENHLNPKQQQRRKLNKKLNNSDTFFQKMYYQDQLDKLEK
jgi:hypothetical protein